MHFAALAALLASASSGASIAQGAGEAGGGVGRRSGTPELVARDLGLELAVPAQVRWQRGWRR
jgi:hypothetical protein